MSEQIIVVSMRKGAPPVPPGYSLVRIDRKTPFGNPFPLTHDTPAERQKVLRQYEGWLMEQLKQFEPELSANLYHLIQRVAAGEKLALQCWCAPKACHGHILRAAILEGVEHQREKEKQQGDTSD